MVLLFTILFTQSGLFSIFDSDIIKTADVYSAGFSAEYGGRVSAIIDVQTRNGNAQRFCRKNEQQSV